MNKIAITSKSFGPINEELLNKLDDYSLITNNQGKLGETDLVNLLDDNTVGVIAGTEPYSERVLSHLPNLKVISRYGVGLDNIDVDSTKQRSIKIFTTSSYIQAVAEQAIAMIFYFLKKLNVDAKEHTSLLEGKSIGIIGYGRVGQRLHQLLMPYSLDIHIYDKYISEYSDSDNFRDIIRNCDIISLHCPLTEDTKNMISRKEVSQMKEGAILINTARAGIIDEKYLTDLLSKNIKLGLDVMNRPPDTKSPSPNILYTDHTASYAKETRIQMEREAVDNLLTGLE